MHRLLNITAAAMRMAIIVLGVACVVSAPRANAQQTATRQAHADEAPQGLLANVLRLRGEARSEEMQVRLRAQQLLAIAAAEAGEYAQAEAAFQPRLHLREGPAADPCSHAEDAATAVARRAAGQRVVMINEAHHVARTRLLTLSLLAPLRREGFTHLALEALNEADIELVRLGFPTDHSGPYLREPVFAELVREALALGYVLVPYEYLGEKRDQQTRETAQATKLADLLRTQPQARLLVHAGYAHIYRDSPETLFGARSMAEELERISGVHALSVDQIALLDHQNPANDHPARATGLAILHDQADAPRHRPFVLVDDDGRPWSLAPDAFDISVFSIPADAAQTWRSLGGRRQPRDLGAHACGGAKPCLIEARNSTEPAEAIPADRGIVEDDRDAVLWLAEGCYRITATGPDFPAATTRYCTANAPISSPLVDQ